MEYTDFETRLFKKLGSKNFHLLLDTLAKKVSMSSGITVEQAINDALAQINLSIYKADQAQLSANTGIQRATEAIELAETKLDSETAADELAGNGLNSENGKLNVDNNAVGGTFLYDGVIDFDDEEQVAEIIEDKPEGTIVAYDCCPDCDTGDDPVYINGIYNTREIITESGEWEAPVSGTYKVTLISGGNSGMVYSRSSYGGASGKHITEFVTLVKGQKVSVVIGAGGVFTDNGTNLLGGEGGETSFGELSTININNRLQPMLAIGQTTTAVVTAINGSGFGGGIESKSDQIDGTWYGAGGAAHFDTQSKWVGNGYQGCVIAEWYDASKDKNVNIDMASSVTIKELQSQIADLDARVQELENNE